MTNDSEVDDVLKLEIKKMKTCLISFRQRYYKSELFQYTNTCNEERTQNGIKL